MQESRTTNEEVLKAVLKSASLHTNRRPYWYDTVNHIYLRFTNPKQFRRYLRENSLGHTIKRSSIILFTKIMAKLIGFHNFHLSTKVVFQIINQIPNRQPDFISPSQSKYWYCGASDSVTAELKQAKTDEQWLLVYNKLRKEEKRNLHIIRQSNHWCYGKQLGFGMFNTYKNKIASCKWFLSVPFNNHYDLCKSDELIGKAYLHDFTGRLRI